MKYQWIAALVLTALLAACAYTGHELRNAAGGGTAHPEEKADPRHDEPIRPAGSRVSVR